MNISRTMLCMLWLVAALAWQPQASAQARELPPPDQYSESGADTCLMCHDDEDEIYSASALFKGKHAHRGDKRAPFGAGGLQCEACHGPGAQHAAKGSKKKLSINSFKADSHLPVAQRNQACLTCHEGQSRNDWHGGLHDLNKVACTDCHKIHAPSGDAVLVKATEPGVCYTCHANQRADFYKASAHPVRFGLIGCSDCHNPHGASSKGMLTKATLNQTCYSCHAEKRGPLLWEHAPVTEDCALCHTPHGSVRNALLTKTPPLLCQQCHSPAGHPPLPRTPTGLPGGGGGGSIFLVGSSCMNCHTQVHGSNHPSGAKLMR